MGSTISKRLKSSLSVAVITHNEADNLEDCLKSVAFAEQVVVVDSGSTDDTVRIAHDFGCEVFLEPWREGFGAQKQFAIDQCRLPWVLVLDADERIPPETAEKIRDIVTNPALPVAGYSFPRKKLFPRPLDQACRMVARSDHPAFSKKTWVHDRGDHS